MISQIRIRRFKCFDDLTVPFANITVLAGNNGTGKSTVLQALLLLRQAHVSGSLISKRIPLNGDLVKIGTARDALSVRSQEDTVVFSIVFSQKPRTTYEWTLEYDKNASQEHFMKCHSSHPTTVPGWGPFAPRLAYLMAERWGPRLTYPMSELPRRSMNVGTSGEYTAHCLAEFGKDPIANTALVLVTEDDVRNLSLENQTQLWMRKLIPDIAFNVESIVKADRMRLEARFFTETSQYLRPTNMGFGISYSLPIVVGALMAESNSLMIVENPEAHLHPAAQSQIGQFLARAASSGCQIILETHSDHVLNGIRVAVKDRVIAKDAVSILFFARGVRYEGNVASRPRVYDDGGIDNWPTGFFDQLEKDLEKLI